MENQHFFIEIDVIMIFVVSFSDDIARCGLLDVTITPILTHYVHIIPGDTNILLGISCGL